MNKRIIIIAVITLIFGILTSVKTFASTDVLKNDTNLAPVSWSKTLCFKAGNIETDEKGNVIEGMIALNYNLSVCGNPKSRINFKAGTIVCFEKDGGVKKGVLAGKTAHYIEGSNAPIILAGSTEVTFGDSGGVISGILANDTVLRLFKDKTGKFKAGTHVEFGYNGKVISGSKGPSFANDNPYAGKYSGEFEGTAKGKINAIADNNGIFSITLTYENNLGITITGIVDEKGNIYCTDENGTCSGKFSDNNTCSGTWTYGKNASIKWKAGK